MWYPATPVIVSRRREKEIPDENVKVDSQACILS
jgi:hypothetical protein